MENKFQPMVREAIDLIWKHHGAVNGTKGQMMLRRAAEEGDEDAWGLLSLTYLGYPWVWADSNFKISEEEADRCLQKSLSEGSPVGLMAVLSRRGLYPTEQSYYIYHWGDEFETAITEMEEYAGEYAVEEGEAIAAYLLGMAYLRGGIDILIGKRKGKEDRQQWALHFFELSREQGLDIGDDVLEQPIEADGHQLEAECYLKVWLQNGFGLTFGRYGGNELQAAVELLGETYRSIELCRDREGEYLSLRLVENHYELQAMSRSECALRKETAKEQVLQLLQDWQTGSTDFSQAGWQTDEQSSRMVKWQYCLDRAEKFRDRNDENSMVAALNQAVKFGCGKAMNWLGRYCQGKEEYETAAQWFLNASQTEVQDDVKKAFYYLGCLNYEAGNGTRALGYLDKAVELGEDLAWVKLGNCYMRGLGTSADSARAIECYENGAKGGDFEAMYALACTCMAEEGEGQDLQKAISYLRRVALEENDWQNEARIMLAKAFMVKNYVKYASRVESLLLEAKYDKYYPGWLELAHFYKSQGSMDSYGREVNALAELGYEPALKEKEDIYRESD